MHQARQESTQDSAQTHTFSTYALALTAVLSVGLGVLLRDVAQDWLDAQREVQVAECKVHREQAALYAKALTNLLNGGRVSLPGVVLSCKTKQVNS